MQSRYVWFTALTASLGTFAFSALAQQPGDGPGPGSGYGYGYHPHMWGSGGWGGWDGGWFHGPLMVIVTIVILALVVMGVARLMGCTGGRCGHRRGASSALAILEERFAKGEIDKAEFEERKNALKS